MTMLKEGQYENLSITHTHKMFVSCNIKKSTIFYFYLLFKMYYKISNDQCGTVNRATLFIYLFIYLFTYLFFKAIFSDYWSTQAPFFFDTHR